MVARTHHGPNGSHLVEPDDGCMTELSTTAAADVTTGTLRPAMEAGNLDTATGIGGTDAAVVLAAVVAVTTPTLEKATPVTLTTGTPSRAQRVRQLLRALQANVTPRLI